MKKTTTTVQCNIFCTCGGEVKIVVRETDIKINQVTFSELDGIDMYCIRCGENLSHLIEYKNVRGAGDLD